MGLEDKEYQNKVETALKGLKIDKNFRLPIYDNEKTVGCLSPVQADDINDSDVVSLLAEWRQANKDSFPTQFKVTMEGTKKWLDEQVINKSDRILFMVYSNGKPIGHMGLALFNYHYRFCEIDNVVRGSEDAKGIMTLALNAIIRWAFEELGLSFLSLRVFSDNARAIALYQRCGFLEVKRIPLERIEENDAVKFIEIPYGSMKRPDRYFALMSLQNPHEKPKEKMILTAGPSISEKEVEYVLDAVKNGWNQSWNKYIKEFEKRFAEYTGVKYAMATSSATGALHLSLLALGVKPGDEVILPDLCWVASASAVCYCGAKPVFADISRDTWCLDPVSMEKCITERTKAVIPVHSYGYPCDMNSINKIAKEHGLFVLEDAAPSVGSTYMGKKTGSLGDIAAFSFQGAKILVTGEGGMVVTDNENLYERALFLNGHGRDPNRQFWIKEVGYKYLMSNLQAALGLAQLERVDGFVEKKRRIFSWYHSRLSDIQGLRLVAERDGIKTNHWMTSVVLEGFPGKRSELMIKLKEKGIDTRPFFYPNSGFQFFEKADNPVSYFVAENGINLPSGVNLTEEEVDYIAGNIRNILKEFI